MFYFFLLRSGLKRRFTPPFITVYSNSLWLSIRGFQSKRKPSGFVAEDPISVKAAFCLISFLHNWSR